MPLAARIIITPVRIVCLNEAVGGAERVLKVRTIEFDWLAALTGGLSQSNQKTAIRFRNRHRSDFAVKMQAIPFAHRLIPDKLLKQFHSTTRLLLHLDESRC
jgi:hypothetical protein